MYQETLLMGMLTVFSWKGTLRKKGKALLLWPLDPPFAQERPFEWTLFQTTRLKGFHPWIGSKLEAWPAFVQCSLEMCADMDYSKVGI